MKQGSAIIIKNNEGRLLLQHRDNNAPTDKNTWALWGGTKEGDETSEETAVRELKEELNIEVLKNKLALFKVYVVTFDNLKQKEISVFELKDEGDYKYELHEGDDLKFFSSQEIKLLQLDSVAKSVFTDYFNGMV